MGELKSADDFFESVGKWAIRKWPERIHPDAYDFDLNPVVAIPPDQGVSWQLTWMTPNDQWAGVGPSIAAKDPNDVEFQMPFDQLLEEVLSATKRKGLDTSALKVGDRLLWEPTLPHAAEECIVVEITTNSDGETWVALTGSSSTYWNEIERVQEACVWPADWKSGKWREYHPVDTEDD